MEVEGKKQIHVLMFPWLAQGHIVPFIELSKRLANHGLKVTFLSTPRNIAKNRAILLDKSGNINLVELALPAVDGLPAGAESTADIPNEMEGVLKTALDGLEQPFEEILRRLSPDYVVYDFAQYWAATVAAKIGIPAIFFLIFTAAVSGYMWVPKRYKKEETTAEDMMAPPKGFPSKQIVWRPFEAPFVARAFNQCNGGVSAMNRACLSVQRCSFLFIRSSYEMEGKFIEYLERATGKSVFPVGPLPRDLPEKRFSDRQESVCLRWLDKQPESSVVYVSFGSECFLTKDQIFALARGLEATGLPFLWVLRFPRFSNEECNVSELLPEGFETRTRDSGLVYGEWAPQLQILSHPSVGVFLSHSGWSSVVEAMKFGVKLVLLPMNNDQGLNARLVAEELKMGLEVEREEDGSFTEDYIRTAVLKVAKEDSEEGELMKLRISEMRKSIFGDSGLEEKYIHPLIERLDRSPSTN